MSLSDKKSFYRWLDQASKVELITRRDAIKALLPDLLADENAVIEARNYLRNIEQELISRVMK
jgi:hypothetical protein